MAITVKDSIFCPCPGPTGAPHGIALSLSNNATKVFINNVPLVCVGDEYLCSDGTKSKIIFGSSKVFINGKPMAIISSTTDHGGIVAAAMNLGKFIVSE